MAHELVPDDKGMASLTLGQVIEQTKDNFPDPRFRPVRGTSSRYYRHLNIKTHPYGFTVTADGIGTKPELAERLSDQSVKRQMSERAFQKFGNLAFDTFAMVESDIARFGRFAIGIANVVDTNVANPEMIHSLALGMKNACDAGQFALLNGETAELRYRTSGYGDNRINWNAFGVALINPEKELLGEDLEVGQPLVAIRELGIRSNGLTAARRILETDYLFGLGYATKEEYFKDKYEQHLLDHNIRFSRKYLNSSSIFEFLDQIIGHKFLEQVLPPWHETHVDTVDKLLLPSTLYSPLMYAALGGVDGPKQINVTGAAHISGGGVPEKVGRMVEPKGLGANVAAVFPEPEGIADLLAISGRHESRTGKPLITQREASENWGRGNGFMVVVRTMQDADELIALAGSLGYEAKLAGEITEEPIINFKGEPWPVAA